MAEDIKQKAQGIEPSAEARDMTELADLTGNIYESLNVVFKRADQISQDLKRELHNKLDEFASTSENLEEIQENKEQIEISKFYERLPNPALIALNEFREGDIGYWFKETKEESEKKNTRSIM